MIANTFFQENKFGMTGMRQRFNHRQHNDMLRMQQMQAMQHPYHHAYPTNVSVLIRCRLYFKMMLIVQLPTTSMIYHNGARPAHHEYEYAQMPPLQQYPAQYSQHYQLHQRATSDMRAIDTPFVGDVATERAY